MTDQSPKSEDLLGEALAESGRQARSLGACSICWALIAPGLRDQHLDWHASLVREVERERLPQVYGGLRFPIVAVRLCDRCRDEATGLGSSAPCVCGPNAPCEWCGQGAPGEEVSS